MKIIETFCFETRSGLIVKGRQSVRAVLRFLEERSFFQEASGLNGDASVAANQFPDILINRMMSALENKCRFNAWFSVGKDRCSMSVRLLDEECDLYSLAISMSWLSDERDCRLPPDEVEKDVAEELGLNRGLRSVAIAVQLDPGTGWLNLDFSDILGRLFLPDPMGLNAVRIVDALAPSGWVNTTTWVPVMDCGPFRLTVTLEGLAPRFDAEGREVWQKLGPALRAPIKEARRESPLVIFARPMLIFEVESTRGNLLCREPVIDERVQRAMCGLAGEIYCAFEV